MTKDKELELLEIIKAQQFIIDQKNKIIDENVLMTFSDTDGKVIEVSQAYLDFTGYKREEVVGKDYRTLGTADIDPLVTESLWCKVLEDDIWNGELKSSKASGEEYWSQTTIKPVYGINNEKTGYLSVTEDITNKKRFEELSTKDPVTLLYNKKYFDYHIKKEFKTLPSSKETIALIIISIDQYHDYKENYGNNEANRLLLSFSGEFQKIIKDTQGEEKLFKTSESEFTIIISNKNDVYVEKLAKTILESIKTPNTKTHKMDILTLSIGVANINTQLYSITSTDLYNLADANLSRSKKQGGNTINSESNQENIQNLRNIDPVTKLPNRTVLINDLAKLKNEAMLVILHINQLNSLRELYGEEFTTDIVKRKSYELIDTLNSKECSLYNLNLQEFAILIPDKVLFEKYLLILTHSLLIPKDSNNSAVSKYHCANFTAGIAYGVERLYNHADLVLQEAIISKSVYLIYQNNLSEKQVQEDSLKRLKVYKDALITGNIIPYFQPIIDSSTGSVVKYEALARIETDQGEIISPYHFLDAAKEDKTFEFFTRQMMQKVFNIFAKNNVHISMNLTYENINSESMVAYIVNRLEKYGGDGITFEILESEDILDYATIDTFISKVKAYGCKISIDDFGTGYSNFTNIVKLDTDFLKLDGSLIQKLNTDENVRHMIKGILEYAKNANMKTVAEFVSSKELADTVIELGIDYLQGYYYGEPKSPQEYGLV